jgi:hypothetical protein
MIWNKTECTVKKNTLLLSWFIFSLRWINYKKNYSVSGGFDGTARWWRIWWMEVKETGWVGGRECLMSFIEWRDESGCPDSWSFLFRWPLFVFFFFFGWRSGGGCDCKLFSVERVKCNIDDPHVSPFYLWRVSPPAQFGILVHWQLVFN